MQFQEYPKALYRGEDMVVSFDAAGEALARADGYADWRPPGVPADPVESAHADAPAPPKRKASRKAAE